MRDRLAQAAFILAALAWAALSIHAEATAPRPTFAAVAAQLTWSR